MGSVRKKSFGFLVAILLFAGVSFVSLQDVFAAGSDPVAPSSCSAVRSADGKSVQVQWTPANKDNAHRYIVIRSRNNGSWYWMNRAEAPQKSLVNETLRPQDSYRFRVYARTKKGKKSGVRPCQTSQGLSSPNGDSALPTATSLVAPTTVTTQQSKTSPTSIASEGTTSSTSTTRVVTETSEKSFSKSTTASATQVDAFTPVNGKPVVWGDNFDSLDSNTWALEHSTYGDGNNEAQCYSPKNVKVAGGQLVLTAKNEVLTCPNGSTRKVSSGMVRSKGVSFSPGQGVEFRVKLTPADEANQAGLWPAVWSSGWGGGGWPAGGELDYLEMMTAKGFNSPVFSMHFADNNGNHDLINKHQKLQEPFSAKWRTIRFDYGKNGQVRWYLDGNLVNTVDIDSDVVGNKTPFSKTVKELKINLAIGGRPGPLDTRALGADGATFAIDYIKIFPLS